jgi:NADH-quinone oxidoreductase subunit J
MTLEQSPVYRSTRRARRMPAFLTALLLALLALPGWLAGDLGSDNLAMAQGAQPGGIQPKIAPLPAGQAGPGLQATGQVAPAGPGPGPGDAHADKAKFSDKALNQDQEGHGSYGTALIFWLFALLMVAGSIFVITRRNLITAVMGMVGTFFAIAAVYAMLYAHFLTAIQVLVYAGAIMVLFVFVIMILNKPETQPWSVTNLPGKVVIMAVLGYLLLRFILVLWNIEVPDGAIQAPADIVLASGESVEFGSTKALGHTLFRDYLFPFEAVSLVLLIAIVGAIAVARPHERRPATIDNAGAGDDAQPTGGAAS